MVIKYINKSSHAEKYFSAFILMPDIPPNSSDIDLKNYFMYGFTFFPIAMCFEMALYQNMYEQLKKPSYYSSVFSHLNFLHCLQMVYNSKICIQQGMMGISLILLSISFNCLPFTSHLSQVSLSMYYFILSAYSWQSSQRIQSMFSVYAFSSIWGTSLRMPVSQVR